MALGFVKHWLFIILTYILILVPLAVYEKIDVTDSRWRNHERRRIYTIYRYLIVAAIVLSVFIFITSFFAGEGDPDFHELGTLLLAIVANGSIWWKLSRGLAISQMLLGLGRLMRIRGDGDEKFEGYVGGLVDKLSSTFMDDDIPGDGPRIRWAQLLFRETLWWRRQDTVHTFDAFLDLSDFVLLVVVWAWRCLGQVEPHLHEYEHLWWLVRGLDHAVVVGLMHGRGTDFDELDKYVEGKQQHQHKDRDKHIELPEGGTKPLVAFMGWFDIASLAPYSPKFAAKQLAEKKNSTLNEHPKCANALRLMGSFEFKGSDIDEDLFEYTAGAIRLWLATLSIEVTDDRLPVKVDVKDVWHDDMGELKACDAASANSLLVRCALEAVPSIWNAFPTWSRQASRWVQACFGIGSGRHRSNNEKLEAFARSVLFRACRHGLSQCKDREGAATYPVWKKRGSAWERIYTNKYLKKPQWFYDHYKQPDIDIDQDRIGKTLPAFVVAYATSIMPLLRHVATASEAEQEAAIDQMPAIDYHAVCTPRLALIGMTSFQRQLASLVPSLEIDAQENSSTKLEAVPGSNGQSSIRDTAHHDNVTVAFDAIPTDMQKATQGSACMSAQQWCLLLKSCSGLLQVADRLMLHSEDMFTEPPMDTWDRVSPMLRQPDVRDAARGLFRLFLKSFEGNGTLLASSMLGSLRYDDQDADTFLTHAKLDHHGPAHITMMMAITFASVVCCGCTMDPEWRSTPAAGTRAEPSMRNDLLVMAALHHAVSTGWEVLLWQISGRLAQHKKKTIEDLESRYGLDAALEDWGIQWLHKNMENPGYSTRHPAAEHKTADVQVDLLAPSAAAKVMAAQYSSSGEAQSVESQYESSGLKVGESLLTSFRSLTSNLVKTCG